MSSSKRWLTRQRNDPYVKAAKQQGLRSRAAFKLKAIQEQHKFIKPYNNVVDLGSAPGSWSELCQTWLTTGTIVACDLLDMQNVEQVSFIKGDFTEPEIQTQILAAADNKINIIISDMSPNKTGVKKVDQWQSTALCELLLQFTDTNLLASGNLLFKCFHGDGFEDIIKSARHMFDKVKCIKPDASRKDSTEVYLLCLAKKTKA